MKHIAGFVMALVVLGWPLAAAPVSAAGGPVQMTVSFPLGNWASLGSWVPVRVELVNGGGDQSGTLIVSSPADKGGSGTSYDLNVSMPGQSRKAYTISGRFMSNNGGGQILVQLVVGGQVVAEQPISTLSRANDGDVMVGYLGRDASPANSLAGLVPNGTGTNVHLTAVDPTTLPTQAAALNQLNVIIANDIDLSGLSEAQRQALAGWVSLGGELIVGGGPNWSATVAGLPPNLLPVAVDGTTEVSSLPALANYGNRTIPAGQYVISTGAVRGGTVLVRAGSVPVVVEAPHAEGSVVYLATDISLDPLVSWSGARTFWTHILAYSPAINPALASSNSGGFGGGPMFMGGPVNQSGLAGIASFLPGISIPTVGWMWVVILLYILLIGPITYFVLRRTDRKDLIWGVVPAVAILFGTATFVGGTATQQHSLILNSAGVIEALPGTTQGQLTAYTSWWSIHNSTHDVSLPGNALMDPYSSNGGFNAGDPNARVHLRSDGQPDLSHFALGPLNSSQFRYDATVDIGGNLEGTLTLDSKGRLTGTLTNHSRYTINAASLAIQGADTQALGAIAPGQTIRISTSATPLLSLAGHGSTANTSACTSYVYGKGMPSAGPNGAPVPLPYNGNCNNNYMGYGYGYNPGNGPLSDSDARSQLFSAYQSDRTIMPTLLVHGWLDSFPGAPTVQGEDPTRHEHVLYVAPLSYTME